MKLSTLCILLGAVMSLPQIYGLMNPKQFATTARKFPRSVPLGWALMVLGTAWFLYNVDAEAASDFATYKDKMMIFFAAVGLGTCVFVKDFLAVRGLAVLFLLLAKLMVDTARWVDSDWRLVIVVWAYVLVIAGMWFTVSPWRFRDLINWATADEKRIKVGCVARLAFAILVLLLGLTVFRSAEAKEVRQSFIRPVLGPGGCRVQGPGSGFFAAERGELAPLSMNPREHRTSNIERPTSKDGSPANTWMFDVRCWVLDVSAGSGFQSAQFVRRILSPFSARVV